MAQKGIVEAKARKEYRVSTKNGANPIKEKTLNKKLLAFYPDNADEIPEIVARILSEGESARQQQQDAPDPAAVSPGGVPLTAEQTPSTSEPAEAPGASQDSTKISKTAAKKAKKAEKALQRSQQEEAQQLQDSSQPSISTESPAPGQDTAQTSDKPSKGALKRAKKAEKAQQMQQQQQDEVQQAPTATPVPEQASEPASSENPEKLSKGAMKRAKKAEKALQKQQQQQEENQQVLDTSPTPAPASEPTPAQPSTQNQKKQSKGAAKRAKKAEKAMQQKQRQEDTDAWQNFNPPEDAKPAEVYVEPAQTVTEFTWGEGPLIAPPKTVKNEKAAKPWKKEKKEKKGKKKQQAQQTSSGWGNGMVSQNGDNFDWAEDQNTAVEAVREVPPNSKVQELKAYIGAPNGSAHKSPNTSVLDRQLELLGLDVSTVESDTHAMNDTQEAVLFAADLLDRSPERVAPQYALLGSSAPHPNSTMNPSNRRMFLNTNIPFSAFICGVQGSGKSHTTSCLIENCMIQSSSLGVLKKPLSTLVLHLGEHSSSLNLRPSEAAFLSSPGRGMPGDYSQVSVTVLTSPSNYPNLRALYSQMPNVEIRPFMLQPKHLNVGTMLALMSVDKTQSAPLYMGQVTKILRDMASQTTGDFDYLDFRRRLGNSNLDGRQIEFLNQRLDLLESFLDLKGQVKEPNFEAGKVTIIDLSCPFVDSNTACVLFNIGLGMFLQSDLSTGKNIVVDEAHKYMTDTPAAKQLTESLLAIIRQQRHYGVRVIISTQEPTINPRLIDLCSVTVIHRFYSPEWFNALRKHISPSIGRGSRSRNRGRSRPQSNGPQWGESDENSGDSGDADDETGVELFKNISALGTGEALVFAPSAILGIGESGEARKAESLFKMKMRKRVTWDGGKSMVCV